MKRRQRIGFLFLLPSLAGVSLFFFFPFLDVIRRSFVSVSDGSFVGLKNYQAIFSNQAFLLAAGNTARFLLICIPVLVALSLLLALCLFRMKKLGPVLKSIFLFPMAIPVASVVLLWRVLFAEGGMVNGWLDILGLQGTDWMNTGAAFWILVGSYLWRNLGYDVVLWLAGLSGISQSLYEAARVDGAGEWQCFTRITMPNLLPSLFTISVLSLLNAFKVFREAYLVAGDYPHESMYLLWHLFNNWYRELSLEKMAAAAVVCALVILGLVLCLQKAWDSQEVEEA